jgi:hypothetical protein
MLTQISRQVFAAIDLNPIRKHLLEGYYLLHEITGHPLPTQDASWLDQLSPNLTKDLPASVQSAPAGDGMDIAFESMQLEDKTRSKLKQVHEVLSKDRGHLLEVITSTSKGSRSNIPDTMQHVLNELTEVILILTDALLAQKTQ